jgi:Ca-activated chloride channel homolog
VYAGSAGLILNGCPGKDKKRIENALENLQAGGSTAGGEGINLAYDIAKDNYIKNGNNRIILSTDGDFNVGISSVSELEKLIALKRNEGIYLSVLGFGQGNIKDNTMETLADKGNGNYYFIDNILEARKVLFSQFGGTLNTIAKDVKIQVEFNPAKVKEYRLIGYENRMLAAEDFNDDKKDAGELGAGHCVTALYEIVPAGSAESKTNIDDLKYSGSSSGNSVADLATIKFRYKGPKKNDTISILMQKIVYPVILTKENTSSDLKLAAAVSEFGMLLRDSKEKGNSSYDSALMLAYAAKGEDTDGYIAGLVDLIKIAKDLQPVISE